MHHRGSGTHVSERFPRTCLVSCRPDVQVGCVPLADDRFRDHHTAPLFFAQQKHIMFVFGLEVCEQGFCVMLDERHGMLEQVHVYSGHAQT
jgi:hypothetical protein